MNEIDILKNLIAIPSFPVYTKEDKLAEEKIASSGEEAVAAFIEKFMKENCANFFLEKQLVKGARYNLIFSDCRREKVKLWFFCHMDTVNPSSNHIDNGKMIIKEDNESIYGLGAVDMKGGTAAILAVISSLEKKERGIGIVFYCDEEFNFAGMKELIKLPFSGELAIFCEPTDLKITPGCRGIVEIEAKVWGKRAHASRSFLGNNAIIIATKAFSDLKEEIASSCFFDDQLGYATCNLGYIKGGIWDSENKTVKRSANNVPDVAEIVLECRNTGEQLAAVKVIEMYQKYVMKYGGTFGLKDNKEDDEGIEIIHDGKWMKSDKEPLMIIEKVLTKSGCLIEYSKIDEVGYYDSALFNGSTGITCVSLGPGPSRVSHMAEEYVTKDSLKTIKEVYLNLINEMC